MATINPVQETINLSDIKVDSGFNARTEVGDVSDLVASIGSIGVQTPIGVQKKRGGKYALVYGFRRFAAATEIGVESVPAMVYPTKTDAGALILLNLQENVTRRNLNPMEESHGARRLLDAGMLEKEVIESLGWSKTLYTQRLALLEYSEDVQQAVAEERVTVNQARKISELPEDKQERFIDIAAGLTVTKLSDLVDKELARIDAANNPEALDDEDLEDDMVEADDVDDVNPTEIAASILTSLCDLIAKGVTDEKLSGLSIQAVRAIDWLSLPVDDLQHLNQVFEYMVDAYDAEGASDFDDGEESEEADEAMVVNG